MNEQQVELSQIIKMRNVMLQKEKELYISAVEKINMNTRELLKNDFGTTLVKNCARDIAGDIVRRYFDMGNYYITVDQMFERIINFSYEDKTDLLTSDESIRKAFYNIEDSSIYGENLKNGVSECENAQRQLFYEERSKDKLDINSKKKYRESKLNKDGKIYDELTGNEGNFEKRTRDGKEYLVSDLHADHIQARETIKYNEKYIQKDKVENLREFFNSKHNMQMIDASANTSKSDVRVCKGENGIEYLHSKEMKNRMEKGEPITDITYKATVEQLTNATISQWEKESDSGKKRETLIQKGYLDGNGKVKNSVKKELEQKIRKSQNEESKEIIKDTDYIEVGKDASSKTIENAKKILAGQVIYYVLPPLVFETQTIIRCKDITMKKFFSQLKKAERRIVGYVKSKLSNIFEGMVNNSISEFVKIFFDIILDMLKATVKKFVKVIKQVVISLVNCVKILCSRESTPAEKADSISKILSVSVTAIVMELLFEYLEKQFSLPDWLMEPLQIIITILATNIIMIILQKLDLFDIQYGLLVANIEKIFDEESKNYLNESSELFEKCSSEMDLYLEMVNEEILEIKQSISTVDIYKEEITQYLENLSKIFSMEIDFNSEWNNFIKAV